MKESQKKTLLITLSILACITAGILSVEVSNSNLEYIYSSLINFTLFMMPIALIALYKAQFSKKE